MSAGKINRFVILQDKSMAATRRGSAVRAILIYDVWFGAACSRAKSSNHVRTSLDTSYCKNILTFSAEG